MLHPATQKRLQAIARDLPQGIILSGQRGVGLHDAVALLEDATSGRVEWILPEKQESVNRTEGTITIRIIRRLYDQTKTKATTKRLIVIEKADSMSHQAQNAFLKLLEEPNDQIHFILLAHDTTLLLPTILSRVQEMSIAPISRQQSEALLDDLSVNDPTRRAQLLFLAEGLSDELRLLSSDQAYFETRSQHIVDARTLVQGTVYDALKVTARYKDNRDDALRLLEAATKLISIGLRRQPDDSHIQKLDRFQQAHEAISHNGHIRLQLAAAVV